MFYIDTNHSRYVVLQLFYSIQVWFVTLRIRHCFSVTQEAPAGTCGTNTDIGPISCGASWDIGFTPPLSGPQAAAVCSLFASSVGSGTDPSGHAAAADGTSSGSGAGCSRSRGCGRGGWRSRDNG